MKLKQCSVCLQFVPLWKSNPATCKNCMPRTPIKPKVGDIYKIPYTDFKGDPQVGDFRITSITPTNKTRTATKTAKPINKVSSKEKKRQVAYMALRKEFMKQYPECMFKDCHRPSTECHHIRGRVGELLLDTTEWMAVCTEHHHYIHQNDKECRELGYLKSRLGK